MRALYQWDPSESSLRNSPLGNQKPSVFSCLGLPQDPKGKGNRLELTSEQLQINFQKGLKTSFLTPKMVKMTLSEGQILTILEAKKVVFGLFESCFGDVQKLILSDFPLLWGPAAALNKKKPKVFDCLFLLKDRLKKKKNIE